MVESRKLVGYFKKERDDNMHGDGKNERDIEREKENQIFIYRMCSRV